MRRLSTIGLLVIAWGLHGQDSTFSADVRVVNLALLSLLPTLNQPRGKNDYKVGHNR